MRFGLGSCALAALVGLWALSGAPAWASGCVITQDRSPSTPSSATVIGFANQSSRAVDVFWLDSRGDRVRYFGVDPGRSHEQPTFVGHAWLAVDADGVCRGYVIAQSAPVTYTIVDDLTPTPTPTPAAPCPGAASCPYAALAVTGDRDAGVLRMPQAVAVDGAGRVYVGDQYTGAIQRFAPDGRFELAWGIRGRGPGALGAVGGIAVAPDGTVYVVDSSNDRIQRFTSDGQFLGAFGGPGRRVGEFHFDLGGVRLGQGAGGGISVAGRYVWVADTLNHRIQRFDLDGGGAVEFGSHGRRVGHLDAPQGVWATDRAVYVADDRNDRVQVFALDGTPRGAIGAERGRLSRPYDVAVDGGGRVLVADNLHHRVRVFGADRRYIASFGRGYGKRPGRLAYPRALSVDAAGNVYVADTANGRISVFAGDGTPLRTIGRDGRAVGQFIAPAGVSASPDGGFAVADTVDSRVVQHTDDGAPLVSYGSRGGRPDHLDRPRGIAIDASFTSWTADTLNHRLVRRTVYGRSPEIVGQRGAAPGGFLEPTGIDADGAGAVYVADTGNDRAQKLDPHGTPLVLFGPSTPGTARERLVAPRGVAVGPDGDVFVADSGNDRIVRFGPDGALRNAWGESGTAPGRLRAPSGIAVDPKGDVYVADSGNDRVQVFTSDGALITAWGERGVAPGQFQYPTAIDLDCRGRVIVADRDSHRIQRFLPRTPVEATCLSAPVAPPPPTPPQITLARVTRRTGVLARHGVALRVRCDRRCTLSATGTLRPNRGGLTFPLRALPRVLPAGRSRVIRLALRRDDIPRLQRVLGAKRRRLRLSYSLTARVPAAPPTVQSQRVEVRR